MKQIVLQIIGQRSKLVSRLDVHSLLIFSAPIVITWYFFIALYAHNISGITLEYFWKPFGIATLLTLCLYLIVAAIVRQAMRASLLTSALVLTFFAFGHIATVIGGENYNEQLGWAILVVYVILFIGIGWYFKKGNPGIEYILKFASIVTVASIVIALISVVPVEIERFQSQAESTTQTTELPLEVATQQPENRPDIYYLVFDRYAGVHTLSDYYSFDNQPFLDQLRDQGFYVAEDSYANYPKTTFSLSSSLNLAYLQSLIDFDDPALSDATTTAPLLSHNKVGQTLKELGYTYYHIGNWYELTDTMDVADVNIQPDRSDFVRYDTFTDMVLESTYLPLVQQYIPFVESPADSKVRHRMWSEFQHRAIKDQIPNSSPKFVVLHMLMPHDPYVYDQECNPLNPPLDRWNATLQTYTNQLQCTNKIITGITTEILENSDNPPIIIVQSDEGPEPKGSNMTHHWEFKNASLDNIKERTNILNAYYFPDQKYQNLYQSITPVNSFRTIFRQYFDLDTPNLADKVYVFPDKDHLFEFEDVTGRLAD